jgi:hypothetical protein
VLRIQQMVRYFIGSVLSPYEKEEVAEGDSTFGFTRAQADSLDLTNIPVRMEHHPDMKVGHIIRSWSEKDGSKWCLGKLEGKGFQSKFSQHAVDKNPDTGKPYYEGLSLQHAHIQLASGKTQTSKKEAIEVSLVCEPRRSDCRIAFVDGDGEEEPKADQIKKTTYILNQRTNKMSTEKTATETPAPESNEQVQNPPVEDGKSSMGGVMSKESMMKIIIEQQKSLEASKTQQNSELDELRQLKAQIEEQREEEKRKQAEKSYAMAQTVVNQWSDTLDKEQMSDTTKDTILAASKTHPEQMIELLRVAHCASKKAKETQQRFEEYKSLVEKNQLSKQFDAVMSKKNVVESQSHITAPVVHAASNKKRKTMSDPEMFLKALSQYNSSGSARDHMQAVSQIGQRKNYQRREYY